jgi:hypothetical protein
MLCDTCSKLLILNTARTCIKCQGIVIQNIAVLCEACSIREKLCAACLKKVYQNKFDNPIYKNLTSGCKACGK